MDQTLTDPEDSDAPVRRESAPPLGRGASLGRYVVLDRLGEGGMGVVYAAYDPELDRKIAIKLLREHAAATPERRARLLREAQALARLDHPNVVAVYDVGTVGDGVFVAMELVSGQTVTAWLAEAKRSWRDIVDVYAQAGRGLAYAHSLGIIHRDFKPENVLVDADGRVHVVDFGLARAAEDAAEPDAVAVGSPLGESLTRTGALVGTPGYIAPEQQHGKIAAAADQFSFCVALWRSLHGELPFAGDSAVALAEAARTGALRSPRRDARTPAWLQRLLRRGLAAEPDKRFPSMQALLDVIRRHRTRRTYAIAAVIAVPLLVGGAVAVYAARSEPAQVCRGADRQLVGIWDGERRAALAHAFAATKLSYAETATAGVTKLFDDYAAQWIAMRTDACEATRVRGEQSEDLLDLRMACLDERARDFRALSDVYVHADPKAVERWYQAAQALPPLDECSDTVALKAPVRLPASSQVRARIDELNGRLAEARALDSAGKFGDAVTRATAIVAEARTLGYRPLEASALLALGAAQRDAGDNAAAKTTLEAAVLAATAGRDDTTAAEAAAWLVRIVGYDLAKSADGDLWIARAQALLEAQPIERVKALLENNIGIVKFGQAKYDESLEHYRTSLALREKLYTDKSPLVAASLDNIGLGYDYKGDTEHGIEYHRKALAIDLAALGDSHPTVSLTLTNLAVSLRARGDLDEALQTAQRAVAIKEKVYGPDSTMVSVSLNEIGNIYFLQRRYPEALAVFQRALEIKKKALGPDHPLVASAIGNLANVYEGMHRFDEALALYQEALRIKLAKLGPDHLDTGHAYSEIGQLELDRGHAADALADFRKALTIWQKSQEPDSPLIAAAYNGIGAAELEAGHASKALDALTAAAKIRDATAVDLDDRAITRFNLAKAYAASGDPARAIPLAQQAIDIFKSAGTRSDAHRHEAETWLSSVQSPARARAVYPPPH